jgi:hypothetical protein
MPCPFGFHAAAEDDCDDASEEQQQTDKSKQDAKKQAGCPFSVSCWLAAETGTADIGSVGAASASPLTSLLLLS